MLKKIILWTQIILGRKTHAARSMKNEPTRDFGVNLNFHPDKFYLCPLGKCKAELAESPQNQQFIETYRNTFPLFQKNGFIQGPMNLYVQLRQILINWILKSPVVKLRNYQHCWHQNNQHLEITLNFYFFFSEYLTITIKR